MTESPAIFDVTMHESGNPMSTLCSPIQVRHIDHITLVVRDVAASRDFYVGLLGMVEVPRPAFSFGGAWFQAGATLVHLIEQHDLSGPAGVPGELHRKTSRNHHFAFEVDDAAAAAVALKRLGIALVDDAKQRPDGAVQVFLSDPDGHVVELCTSPREVVSGGARSSSDSGRGLQ
jgi:catechol 2,3-dioxygenase-like lactoylglutathione lyase family enzyme